MDETFTWFSLSVAHACMGETNSSRMQEGWASEGPEDIGCSTMMMNILIIVLTIASYLLSLFVIIMLSLFVIIIRYCYRYRYRPNRHPWGNDSCINDQVPVVGPAAGLP